MSDRFACTARLKPVAVWATAPPLCDRNAHTKRAERPLCNQHAQMFDRWVREGGVSAALRRAHFYWKWTEPKEEVV